MIMKKSIICLYWIAMLVSCESDPDMFLYVQNFSGETILAYPAIGGGCTPYAHPDTILPEKLILWSLGTNDGTIHPGYNKIDSVTSMYILPYTKKVIWYGDNENQVYDDLRHDTLSLFIFSRDTLQCYGYDNVRDNYRILVRYDLSIDECKQLNYVFPYPPQPFMRNMKMYPPYSRFIQ